MVRQSDDLIDEIENTCNKIRNCTTEIEMEELYNHLEILYEQYFKRIAK